MTPIPIGITTRNRPVYLDATLRSLSATDLPDGAAVVVYDDDSDTPEARRYLETGEAWATSHTWPTDGRWRRAGLDVLADRPRLCGLAGRVEVVTWPARLGVVAASARAVIDLFDRGGAPPAVILLQDDVLFAADWYRRMTARLGRVCERGKRLGLVAGMHLDYGQPRGSDRTTCAVQFASAQCYLITRQFFTARRGWFDQMAGSRATKNWDKGICRACDKHFERQLMIPQVCQHIGVKSLVRPEAEFYRNAKIAGRVGTTSSGPWVLGEAVRAFQGLESISNFRLQKIVDC